MANTAGLQVCVDVGTREQAAARWALAHEMGPALCAAFANATDQFGRPTGYASQRLRTLLTMDPSRSRPSPTTGDPAQAWARRAVDHALAVRAPQLRQLGGATGGDLRGLVAWCGSRRAHHR